MKPEMTRAEVEMRSRFDFSRVTRGRFSDRYAKGHSVALLNGEPDMEDPLDATDSTRRVGKRIFESHVQAAGLKLAEPLHDDQIDYLIYCSSGRNNELVSYAVQLKTSRHETFSLHKTDVHIPRSLLAYVWRTQHPDESSIYALTYGEALRIIESKGYAKTPSWISEGGYSITHAGLELKEMLEPYKMTTKRWQEKLQAIG
jgi:hypothetical protein